MILKNKHVLLCAGFTDLGSAYIQLLLQNGVKSLTVANGDAQGWENARASLGDDRITHLLADVGKITDLEEVYKKTLEINKRIDVIVNSKEVTADSDWEAKITTHINSLICNTLLAIKHLGKMNGGKGGIVLNAVAILQDPNSEDDSPTRGITTLLIDLEKSFGDPYYHSSTGLRILTLCASLVSPTGAATSSLDTVQESFLKVLKEKKSSLQAGSKTVEEFEISVRN